MTAQHPFDGQSRAQLGRPRRLGDWPQPIYRCATPPLGGAAARPGAQSGGTVATDRAAHRGAGKMNATAVAVAGPSDIAAASRAIEPLARPRGGGRIIAIAALALVVLGLAVLAALTAPAVGVWTLVAAPLAMAVAAGTLAARRVITGGVEHTPSPPDGGIVMTGSIASTVKLDYDSGVAEKRYERTRLVRALYRVAFQAPFPYRDNEDALEAALHRRTVAGLLTQHWFGERMVARAFDAHREPDDSHTFVTELIRGTAPTDRGHAKDALRELTARFDEAGLPTWQVGWYNPRALGNLIEQADDSYRIIDLESNLVTPVMPPSELVRALRAGQFPAFDDIDVERLRGYLEVNREGLAASLGEVDARRLSDASEAYAAAAARWHGGERRLLPRALRIAFRLADVPTWVRGIRRAVRRGERLGHDVTVAGIETWQAEGRLTELEAERLRASVAEREVASATRHLGVHLALSIPLRFPLGSIARSLWTLTLRRRPSGPRCAAAAAPQRRAASTRCRSRWPARCRGSAPSPTCLRSRSGSSARWARSSPTSRCASCPRAPTVASTSARPRPSGRARSRSPRPRALRPRGCSSPPARDSRCCAATSA